MTDVPGVTGFYFCLGLRICLSFHPICGCATDRWHYVIVWLELEANNIQSTGFTVERQTALIYDGYVEPS